MCGIAGIFSTNGAPLGERARDAVTAALTALEHRGPDACGILERPDVVLGHKRLAVLDIEGGRQPFADSAEECVLVYNGELYGFEAIRSKLESAEPMRTRSDTEVLLRCLSERGVGGLDGLNGMYAFALFDARSAELTIGVDRVGIKPLYVAERDGWLAFASELEAICRLLETAGDVLSIDAGSVSEYLVTGWIGGPRTLIRGVRKLQPGENLVFGRSGNVRRIVRPLPPPASSLSDGSIEETIAVLKRAVADQLVADVPVGVFLSGGIDSSLLLALGTEMRGPLHTFSVGFELGHDREAYDESPFARLAAEHFGSTHHELQVSERTIFPRIDEIVSAVDEPISDPAVIPLFILAEFAAKHVKVCLTGDGGDELFAGYQYHRLRRIKALVHEGSAVGAVLRGSLDLMRRVPAVPGIPARRLRAVADLALDPRIAPAIAAASWLPRPFDVSGLENDATVDWSDPDRVLLASMRGPLAGAMLPKTDRITMQHSLEARVPFLDDRVISVARALPWSAKVYRGQTKYVLRRALAERAPRALCSRSKRGFRVPLDQWFRGELSFWLRGRIGPGSAVESVLGARVSTLLEQHSARSADHGQTLWALAILERWLQRVDARVV